MGRRPLPPSLKIWVWSLGPTLERERITLASCPLPSTCTPQHMVPKHMYTPYTHTQWKHCLKVCMTCKKSPPFRIDSTVLSSPCPYKGFGYQHTERWSEVCLHICWLWETPPTRSEEGALLLTDHAPRLRDVLQFALVPWIQDSSSSYWFQRLCRGLVEVYLSPNVEI